MFRKFLILGLIIFSASTSYAAADDSEKQALPRFVSTRSNEINVRTGPGSQYPIKWVIVKESMPVEIIAEYEDWRKIRDIQQGEGWTHKAMLSNKRMCLVKADGKKIFSEADAKSKTVAVANKGTILKLRKCDAKFCEVEAKDVDGFIKLEDIWGVYEGEKIKK